MKNFFITIDSTCDYPADFAPEAFDRIPVEYVLDGKTHADGFKSEDDAKAFYAAVRDGKMPTTSLIPPERFTDFVRPILMAGNDVLHVTLSSGLSGTYSCAKMAAEELQKEFPQRKIMVLDSLSATVGSALLVDKLLEYRENHTITETYEYGLIIRRKLNLYFTVDSLKHLHRGGRVSRLTAIVGQIMMIKPVLHVNDEGKLIAIGKVMSRGMSIKWLANKVASRIDTNLTDYVYICHGDCIKDAETLAQMIEAKTGKKSRIEYTGAVIGSHSGPGTLAVFFFGKNRAEGKEQAD